MPAVTPGRSGRRRQGAQVETAGSEREDGGQRTFLSLSPWERKSVGTNFASAWRAGCRVETQSPRGSR